MALEGKNLQWARLRRETPDLTDAVFGKPDVAVGAGCDPDRPGSGEDLDLARGDARMDAVTVGAIRGVGVGARFEVDGAEEGDRGDRIQRQRARHLLRLERQGAGGRAGEVRVDGAAGEIEGAGKA